METKTDDGLPKSRLSDSGAQLQDQVRVLIERVVNVQMERIRLVAEGRMSHVVDGMLRVLGALEAKYLARISRLESEVARQHQIIREIGESSESAQQDLRRLAAGIEQQFPAIIPVRASRAAERADYVSRADGRG